MDYGYEGTAVFPFDLSALQQLPLGNTKLKAHVQWLVCREVCLPGKAFLGLDLDVVLKAPDDTNKLIAAAVQAEPVNTPDSVRVEVNATRNLLTLHVITGKSERSAEYDPLDHGSIRNAAGQPITPTADGVALVTERERLS
jgi:DsbC/DsbD-like thiol-disulfide interchange protein